MTGQHNSAAFSISIEDAVKILNFVRHSDYDGWHIWNDFVIPDFHSDPSIRFSKFEALAIAEKYLSCQGIIFRELNSESTHSESDTTAVAVPQINPVT